MKPILIAENISKRYSRNSDVHKRYGIADLCRAIVGARPRETLRPDEFYALHDVSFALNPGDSLGLVGRNGSGKTTLLKLLNRLITPDAGRILIGGKIQALIALGVGFHPKLSGRENVYNSAALIGMTRRKAHDLIDTIVDFAELGEFIDSPVGTYSSGMYSRLGFSVSIHLDPQILLIDEILAVGDIGFQNKCFTRLHQMKKSGVTIVLVSHNHTQITQLCDQALWLHSGKPRKHGPSKEVVKEYLAFIDQQEANRTEELNRVKSETGSKPQTRSSVSLYGGIYNDFDQIENLDVRFLCDGKSVDSLRFNEDVIIRYSFDLKREVKDLNVSLSFWRADGLLYTTISTLNGDLIRNIHTGRVECEVTVPRFSFNPGEYVLVLPVHEGHSYLYRDIVKKFRVIGVRSQMTWGLFTPAYRYRVLTTGVGYSPQADSAADAAQDANGRRAEYGLLTKGEAFSAKGSAVDPSADEQEALGGCAPLYSARLSVESRNRGGAPAWSLRVQAMSAGRSGVAFSLDGIASKPAGRYLVQCSLRSPSTSARFLVGLHDESGATTWGKEQISGSTSFQLAADTWTDVAVFVDLPDIATVPNTVWIVQWEPLDLAWDVDDLAVHRVVNPVYDSVS